MPMRLTGNIVVTGIHEIFVTTVSPHFFDIHDQIYNEIKIATYDWGSCL